MIAIHIDKVKHVQKQFETIIEKHRKNALKKLKKVRVSRLKLDRQEAKYLDKVIDLFEIEHVLLSTPEVINEKIREIGVLPPNSCPARVRYPLKRIIQEKLNYTYLRRSFYPKYFNKLGLKACVYCNSALTISIEESSSSYSARFDVDHYKPKDEFPFLSIFLFNLYPTCASCNRRKSKSTKIKFKLYSNNPAEINGSAYKFKLDVGSKSKYLISKDVNDLDFTFDPNFNTLQSELKIKEIYDTQIDIIEELMIKNAMYDEYNRKNLYNSFTKLNLHPDLYLRTLIGNYTKEKDIHKRPMSKFMQDIARQLGIID